mmetsp:Transcript_8067/g.35663  ORF Transcript_8067/g.35663 Transcript_8067/m.35663 type:complete len:258 (+) Transcript_8067:186-959(+)
MTSTSDKKNLRHPRPRVPERVERVSLPGSLLGLHVVLPPRGEGQGHEDGLDASAGPQPERGAAIVHEVKLDVPPAAHLLPLLLRLGVLVVLVLGHERDVGGDDGAGHVGGEREKLLLGAIVHVVEEDAADAAALVHAVLDDEVVVGPLLEAGVEGLVVLVAHVLEGAVEVRGVVVENVGRGEVGAAAEPPRAGRALGSLGRIRLEVAVVEVHRGRHGVLWVHDGGDARGEERDHLLAGATLAGGGAVGLGGHLAVHD